MHAAELAAVLIEPIQPNNPTHQPKELLQAIRQVTAENDIALIFDDHRPPKSNTTFTYWQDLLLQNIN